jgi:hypothetical protein
VHEQLLCNSNATSLQLLLEHHVNVVFHPSIDDDFLKISIATPLQFLFNYGFNGNILMVATNW